MVMRAARAMSIRDPQALPATLLSRFAKDRICQLRGPAPIARTFGRRGRQ